MPHNALFQPVLNLRVPTATIGNIGIETSLNIFSCLVCIRSTGAGHPATGLSISRGCWYNKGTTNDKYHVWCGYSTTDDTEIVKCINNFKLCTDHCICTITNALQNCPHFMVEITHFDKESVSLQISHIILTAFPDIASLSWSVKSNLFIPLQSRAKGQLEALDSGLRTEGLKENFIGAFIQLLLVGFRHTQRIL